MRPLILFLSGALILAGSVFGNTNRLSEADAKKVIVSGTVHDATHAVIISSEVVAQDFEGKQFSALTNEEGAYKLELPFATYKIEANASGFCPRRIDILKVRSSLTVKPLDFVLQVAASDRPCPQKTMIKKEQNIRKPEIFRSIAE